MPTVKAILLLSFLLQNVVQAGPPQLTPDEKAILESSPGVVLVIVSYHLTLKVPGRNLPQFITEFEPTSTGTGFLYRPDGYLITNAHVVQDANVKDLEAQAERKKYIRQNVLTKFKERLQKYGIPPLNGQEPVSVESSTPQIRVYLANKVPYTGEIKVYSDPTGTNVGKDIAIVKIDGNNLPTVKLGNSDEIHTGDPLTVIGYPGAASPLVFQMISMESALVPSFTSGHVSAVKTDYKGTAVIQSDAAITHGNSGGPAFNARGEVTGVATYGNTEQAAGINFFVPVNTALEFVRQAGANPEAGIFDKTWESALDSYEAGNWDEAKSLFADALNIMPNLPDALRLQVAASQMARSEGTTDRLRRKLGGAIWLITGGVLVILISITAMVLLRSRQGRLTAVPATAMPNIPVRTVPLQVSAAVPVLSPAKSSPHTFGTLHITAGPLKGNQFPIPKAGLLIGRDSAKCNVVLADDTVSKEHAWVVPVDNEVVVIDRGSSNGTYVNSTESPSINKVTLKNGDRVFIGKKGIAVLTFFSA